MKTPHLLLATANVAKLRNNLTHILDSSAITALDNEITENVMNLFKLGQAHHDFAIRQREWRQCISRLYYAAYNMGRAVRLAVNGIYSTDTADHKQVGIMPDDFPNSATYHVQFPLLRDDRNLADYDHSSDESELAIPLSEAKMLVKQFMEDIKSYLNSRGLIL